MATDPIIRTLASGPETGATMPALFIGHGNPMNAIEDNEFSRAWADVARSLPKPKAVLCVSAHWETEGTRVTAMEQPKTIHDFYGFPPALFDKRYPAPGSPDLARITQKMQEAHVKLDLEWGLDHGAWSVLCRMYPKADLPVVQLSLDQRKQPALHYERAGNSEDCGRRACSSSAAAIWSTTCARWHGRTRLTTGRWSSMRR